MTNNMYVGKVPFLFSDSFLNNGSVNQGYRLIKILCQILCKLNCV
jgi:hypothetical protein